MQPKADRNATDSVPVTPKTLYRLRQAWIASKCQNNKETNITQTAKLFRQVRLFSVICLLFFLHDGTAQITARDKDNSSSRTEVKIGVILPQITGKSHLLDVMFGMEFTMPAIKLAVEKIESNYYSILPGVPFVLKEADSNCSNFEGPLAAIDMYWEKEANVYLGPACGFAIAPAARYSGQWGIPVITAGAIYDSFNDKTTYKSLTRVHGRLDSVVDVLLDALGHFNWTKIGIMYCEDLIGLGGEGTECLHILRPIFKSFSKAPHYVKLNKSDVKNWTLEIADMSKSSRSE